MAQRELWEDPAGEWRLRLARLVAILADASLAPLLRRVLTESREDAEVRTLMAYTLAASGAELPTDELEGLLSDEALEPGILLCMCRTAETRAVARKALSARLAAEAAAGQANPAGLFSWWDPCGWCRPHPVALQLADEIQTIKDELWEEYLVFGPSASSELSPEYDARLYRALEQIDKPEAQHYLLQCWRQATDRASRRALIWHCPAPSFLAGWLADSTPPILETLDLVSWSTHMYPEMVARIVADQYGEDEILLGIEEVLRAASRGDHDAWEKTRNVEWFLQNAPGNAAGETLVSLLACPDIYHSLKHNLRRAFRERVWSRSPEEALAALSELLTCDDADPDFLSYGIEMAAIDPRPERRDLYLRILAESEAGRLDRRFRFLAVHALEQIGEDDSSWRSQLTALSHDDDVCLHLFATAALVRRGARERLGEIRAFARGENWDADDKADHAQGLAVRLVGELAPAEHSELFQSLVLIENDERHAPSAPQEAAFALACLATPTAIVALVRGYLSAEEYLGRAIHHYLPAAVSRLEGRDVAIANRIPLWRYARFPP